MDAGLHEVGSFVIRSEGNHERPLQVKTSSRASVDSPFLTTGKDTPYISVVMAARNDDYGGGFQERLFRAVAHLTYEFAERGTLAEIIVVEWNPDPNAAPLADRLTRAASPPTPLRIITVPHEVHASLPESTSRPMFEYWAKNVGLRRARGEFLLSTNPDIILGSQVHEYLSQRKLCKLNFYRADRLDLPASPAAPNTPDELMRWCEKHWDISVTRWGRIPRAETPQVYLRTMTLMLRAYLWLAIRGEGRTLPHLGAAGDFMLMHESAWRSLHGFKEAAVNLHIDSLMVLAALSFGLDQATPRGGWAVFHQYHSMARAGRPEISHRVVFEPAFAALRDGSAYIGNGEYWGLPDAPITEVVL